MKTNEGMKTGVQIATGIGLTPSKTEIHVHSLLKIYFQFRCDLKDIVSRTVMIRA